MNIFLQRIFRIKSGELGLILTLGTILFINYLTMGITKVVSVSGFLSEVQDYYILLVWAGDMGLLILATGLQSLIIDRFSRIRLLGAIILILGTIYALLPLTFMLDNFPVEISYTLLYLLTDQQWLIFPLIFWTLINDLYSPAQGRRLLPIIGSFAFLGTIIGLLIAQLDAKLHFGATKLLFLNAIVFLLAFGIVFFILRKNRIRHQSQNSATIREAFSGGWNFIQSVPAFRYLSLSMFSAGITITLLLYCSASGENGIFGIKNKTLS
jgi:ATP:ADP antiporter, AAA family